MVMEIQKVGIIGTGTMGLGVAQVIATAGTDVIVIKATTGSVEKPKKAIENNLSKLVERGKIDEVTKSSIIGRIMFSSNEQDVSICDLVIESVIEDITVKKELFQRLERIVSRECILATNTSTLSVTELMAVCNERGRIAGLHFFNPAPIMRLIEVIHAFETSSKTVTILMGFSRQIGKDPVLVQDTTGFIVNRLLTPYMLEAIRLLEHGTGTIDAIDHAMMTGASMPMGPFSLADYIGLDVVLAMSNNIYQDVRQQYCSAPHTLIRLVQLGYLGRKTGKGFYDYSKKPVAPNSQLKHPVA